MKGCLAVTSLHTIIWTISLYLKHIGVILCATDYHSKPMTDHEIIAALIARNNSITQDFFFRQCRPLFTSILRHVFDYEVDYEECVNELYLHLLAGDGRRLRQFEGRSTLRQWLKVTATRFFIKKRDQVIENVSHESLYNQESPSYEDYETMMETAASEDAAKSSTAAIDVESLLAATPNKRYSFVLQQLLVKDMAPEQVAQEMNITVDNLYNIKRRAMQQLMQVALLDIRQYGKR